MRATSRLGKVAPRAAGWAGLVLAVMMGGTSAQARPAFSCAGFALLGGAQLICSHLDPEAPAQTCNFSWSLMSGSGPSIVTGAFVLAPGVANDTVFQGSGYTSTLTNPVVLCQSARPKPEP